MRKYTGAALIAFMLLLLLVDPRRYFDSVRDGLVIFTASVLPSMLPYFFFTKLFTAVGGAEGLTRTLGRPVTKVYRVAPVCSYALVMSLLSGYPVGARVLADLYEKGYIDERDAIRSVSFASTSGSMFVLGSVGSAILGNVRAGWIILIAHYAASLINGFIHCRVGRRSRAPAACVPMPSAADPSHALSDAMYESVLSLALVGGFIAIANLAADMAGDVLSFFGVPFARSGSVFSGIVYSFFEVTRGCIAFSGCAVSPALVTSFCAAAISFGGLSVFLQTTAFLGKAGLRFFRLFIIKSTQAALTFVLCYPLCLLFL